MRIRESCRRGAAWVVGVAVVGAGAAAFAAGAAAPSAIQKTPPAQTPTPGAPPASLAPLPGPDKFYLTIAGPSGRSPCYSIRVLGHRVVVTKAVDAATPALLDAMRAGRVFPSVSFEFAHTTAAGGEQVYRTVTLKKAFVVNVQGPPGMKVVEVTFQGQAEGPAPRPEGALGPR